LAARQPRLARAWQGLGLSYTALSKEAFRKLEAEQPHSGEWFMLAAESELERGQPERAFALLRQADPATPGVHAAIAGVYEKTSHPDWAAAERLKQPLEKLAATPNRNYSDVLRYCELAGQAFQTLAALPESAELHELLAHAKQEQGQRDEALSEWRRAAELAPADSRIKGKLAEALLDSRMYEEALGLLVPLVASNSSNAQWQYVLGDALVRERRSEEALLHLEAAVRLNGNLIPARAALGRVYLQMGQPAKAIPHLKIGLPADEEAILFQLGQAYRATGQASLAESAFARQQQLLRRTVTQPAASARTPPITPP
jgi:predicted Zn-dependent protease